MTLKLRDYQLELIDGVYNSLRQGNKKIMVQSPAGSGKSVTMSEIAKRATDKGNRVLFVVHRRELVNQIKQTFKLNNVNMQLCHVGMIQTVTNQVKRGGVEKPSIILVDEAHHGLAKTYTRIYEAFPDSIVLGFTATSWRMAKKGFTDVFDDLILGKTVQWLIDNNRLAPFKYYSKKLINTENLKRNSTGDYSNDSIELAMESTIFGDVVDNYRKFADNKKTIVYTHSVESSKQVADRFVSEGYTAMQVDGKTPKAEREFAMQQFRSGAIRILVNAELYGEGVDVPDCECVVLVRPTESLTLFIQQTMRAMRYMPGKQAIIIDHVGNYTRHGLPTTDHDWTEYFKGNKKKAKENTVVVRECENCFGVYQGNTAECPHCGYVHVVERTNEELEVDETAELEEITEADVITLDFREPKDCKNMQELYDLAKHRNYKPGWAYHQGKMLGLL